MNKQNFICMQYDNLIFKQRNQIFGEIKQLSVEKYIQTFLLLWVNFIFL